MAKTSDSKPEDKAPAKQSETTKAAQPTNQSEKPVEGVKATDASKASAEAQRAADAAEAGELSAKYEKALAALDKQQGEIASLQKLVKELADKQGKQLPSTALVELVSPALNVDVARANQELFEPADRKQVREARGIQLARIEAKTYRLDPVGMTKDRGLPPALVSNCSDEGDARAAYNKHFDLKGTWPLKFSRVENPKPESTAAASEAA